MIIFFHITDSLGLRHRCSAVCGPSTTAAGAINQLRMKLGIPTEVEVQVHLANDVPIRHLTAPLTSLRKQHSGTTQVLRMQLWASLSGPESAVREINYSAAEFVDPDAAITEEEEDGDSYVSAPSSSSQSVHHNSTSSANIGVPATSTRIIFAGPPSRSNVKLVQAKIPSNIATPLRTRLTLEQNTSTTASGCASTAAGAAATPIKVGSRKSSPAALAPENRSAPLLISPLAEPPSTAPTANVNSIVIKRRDSRTQSPTPHLEMPLSAREPVHRPFAGTQWTEVQIPQSARGVAPARSYTAVNSTAAGRAESNARYIEVVDGVAATLYRTGIARRDAIIGHIMMREYPKIIRREPKRIVAAVKDNARLASLSYSKEFTATSDLEGIDNVAYAHYLSIGLTHGLELRSGDGDANNEGARLALYGELSSLRHSCCPNAAVQYDLFTAPFAGSCRCALLAGIPQGQEITYLYKHADSLAFLLLSRDRRRNILKRKYFMDCDCPRCAEVDLNEDSATAPIVKKKGSKTGTAKIRAQKIGTLTNAQREAEKTLTGAFFTDSTVDRDPKKQRALVEEMRKDFDALQIIDDTGVEISLSLAGNVPPVQRTKQCNRLLAFIRKYGTADSVLRLHEHHWRMNLARAAYVQETVRLCAVKGATPEVRLRDPHNTSLFTPTKTVYNVCLKQLAVEALFIPPGHPHSLTTYESFLYLVAILPPALAQPITRSANNTESIKWKQLEETKEAWSLLKRTALPLQLRRLVQLKEREGSGVASVAASKPLSQPTTARGERGQEFTSTPTIKFPPKKLKV